MENKKNILTQNDALNFKEVFGLLYSQDEETGEFVTYLDVVKFIYNKRIYNSICKIIDNCDLNSILNGKAMFDLAKLVRIYISEYNKKESIILDFLESCMLYSNDRLSDNFFKFQRKMKRYNFPSEVDIEKYINRFTKLNFIDINESLRDKILSFVGTCNEEIKAEQDKNNFEKIENEEDYNLSFKVSIYMPVIKNLYKMYKEGMSIDVICSNIKGNPDTFYNDINFIKNEIDIEYRKFAVCLANYVYNKSLMKKYKVDLINYNYTDVNDLCEHIHANYKGSPYMLCNNLETYIKLSKSVTEKQIKYIRWVEKVYSNYYQEKLANRRQEINNKKIEEAVSRVELYLVSNAPSDYDIKRFNQDIAFLSRNNYPKVKTYLELLSKKQFEQNKDLIQTAKLMAKYIENGIELNGTIRKFDMIDYFLMTDLSFQQLLKIVKEHLSYKEHYVLVTFFKVHTIEFDWNENYIEQAYASEYLTNIKLDYDGNIISARKVSLEEKRAVIDVLNRINVPINEETYCDGIARLIQGTLYTSLEEQLSSNVKSK